MNRPIHIFFYQFKTLMVTAAFVCIGLVTYGFAFPATSQVAKTEVVKCYPNPASSFVNFEFQKNIDKSYVLQVYSFVGKKMVEMPVSNNKITVTLNDFNRGIYVYQLRDKSGETVLAGKFQVIK